MLKISKQNLRTPGPTPVEGDIAEAMSNPMINHRGPEFKELIYRTTEQLKRVFLTRNDLYILTGSGTGALEACVVNTLSPGDKVLSATAGDFGNRFTDIAAAYGANARQLEFPWGRPVDPEAVRKALQDDPEIKAVLVTHNETSTGITHPMKDIAAVVKGEFDKLLLVDAVSSLGCIPLLVDDWGCDLVGTASQKGFMVPPGLAFVSIDEAGHEAQKTAAMPRFYFDLQAAQRYLERGQTPWTPAVSTLYGLSVALDILLNEGMENVFQRHARIAQFTRDGVKSLGLTLFAEDEGSASNTVTAVNVPPGIDAAQLIETMRTERNVVLAGGQAKLNGKIFRIGHLGRVSQEEIEEVLEALQGVLAKLGFKPR